MKNVTILARSLEATLYWLKLLNVIQIKNIPNSFIIGGKIQRRYPCPFCWMKWGTSMITALKLPAGPGWLLNEGPTLASCELGVLQIPSRLAHWSDDEKKYFLKWNMSFNFWYLNVTIIHISDAVISPTLQHLLRNFLTISEGIIRMRVLLFQ